MTTFPYSSRMRTANLARRWAYFGLDRLQGGVVAADVKEVRQAIEEPQGVAALAAREDHLAELIAHVRTTVPFYQAGDWQRLADFPVVTKQAYLADYADHCSTAFDIDELPRARTSGSSGTPFSAPRDPRKRKRHLADLMAFGGTAGFRFGDPIFFFKVSNAPRNRSRVQRALGHVHDVHVDQANEAWARQLDQALRSYREPVAIMGGAAIIDRGLQALMEHGFELADYNVGTVIAGAEPASQWLRTTSKESFGSGVFSRYANEECGILAHQTTWSGTDFLINGASYLVELLAMDRDEPVTPGETGRVVVTDLFSYAMPFIRYDTGDLARQDPTRPYLLAQIEGRQRDVLYDVAGAPVVPAVVTHALNDFTGIAEYRFVQTDRAAYQLLLAGHEDDERDRAIAAEIATVFGEGISFEIRYVADIEALPSGKRRPVVNQWEGRPTAPQSLSTESATES